MGNNGGQGEAPRNQPEIPPEGSGVTPAPNGRGGMTPTVGDGWGQRGGWNDVGIDPRYNLVQPWLRPVPTAVPWGCEDAPMLPWQIPPQIPPQMPDQRTPGQMPSNDPRIICY